MELFSPFAPAAIRAVVIRRKRVDARTMTVKVQVEEVLFCSQVKFPRSNHVTLWTNSSCGCPRLRPGRHYLLAGEEDFTNGRFLLSPSTALAVKWRDKWGARLKVGVSFWLPVCLSLRLSVCLSVPPSACLCLSVGRSHRAWVNCILLVLCFCFCWGLCFCLFCFCLLYTSDAADER